MRFSVHLFFLLFLSNAHSQKKPNFISFKFNNDSVYVFAENKLACPTHTSIEDKITNNKKIVEFGPLEKKKILVTKKDTLQILNDFKFKMYYGASTPLKKYDTLYNYGLPFLKGKRYKILQGQNTSFTHKGYISKYAIDLKMKAGQTVCAMRDGIVVAIKEDSNKGGRSKKYYNDANYIMIYHSDGLFTQYVHLKKDGAIVKIGDNVKKGQPIGYSGNTGMSTEPHLHFGVFKATPKGFNSIPYILNTFLTRKYTKGKYASNK